MEGVIVVLWATHIQPIASQRSILQSTKILEQPGEELLTDEASMFAR